MYVGDGVEAGELWQGACSLIKAGKGKNLYNPQFCEGDTKIHFLGTGNPSDDEGHEKQFDL